MNREPMLQDLIVSEMMKIPHAKGVDIQSFEYDGMSHHTYTYSAVDTEIELVQVFEDNVESFLVVARSFASDHGCDEEKTILETGDQSSAVSKFLELVKAN